MIYFTQKAKKKHTHTIQSCHRWYKTKYKNAVKLSTYKVVNEELNSILMELLICNNVDFKMPATLGHLLITRKKSRFYEQQDGTIRNNFPVDWAATKKLWEQTYVGMTGEEIRDIKNKKVLLNFNDHSGGEKAAFNWDRTLCKTKLQHYYKIRVNRRFDDALSKHIKSDKNNIYKYSKHAL